MKEVGNKCQIQNNPWTAEEPQRALLSQTEGEVIPSAQGNRNEQWVCIAARTLLPSRGHLLNTHCVSQQASLGKMRANTSLLRRQRNITWQMSSLWHRATFPFTPLTTHLVPSGSRRSHLLCIFRFGRWCLELARAEGPWPLRTAPAHPGRVVRLAGALSRYTTVAGSTSGLGTCKKQPRNI